MFFSPRVRKQVIGACGHITHNATSITLGGFVNGPTDFYRLPGAPGPLN